MHHTEEEGICLKNAKELELEIEKFYKKVGENVKKKREEKKFTQLQLSHLLGFKSVGLVSQSELYLKKQHFNLKHLFLIASILECSLQDFFEDVEVPRNMKIDL